MTVRIDHSSQKQAMKRQATDVSEQRARAEKSRLGASSSRDTTEQLEASKHRSKMKTSKHGAPSSRDTTEQAETSKHRASATKSKHDAPSSRDTTEQAGARKHRTSAKRSKHDAPSSRDTTEQAQADTIAKVCLMHRRILIADMGFSGIRQLVGKMVTLSFQEIAQTAEELQAGVILLTGVSFHDNQRRTMKRHFPAYDMKWARTNGSDLIALWHPDFWNSPIQKDVDLDGYRRCLVLNIGRLPAHAHAKGSGVSPSANDDAIQILLTKFHLGTQAQGHAFDAHQRLEAWRRMLEIVHDSPRWIIAGGLAVNELQITQRLKEQHCTLNLSRLLSTDKHISCLTFGIHPSTCESHSMIQSLVLDVPEEPSAEGHRATTCSKEERAAEGHRATTCFKEEPSAEAHRATTCSKKEPSAEEHRATTCSTKELSPGSS